MPVRIRIVRFVVVAALLLGPGLAHADSVCSDEEVRKDKASLEDVFLTLMEEER